MPRARGRTTAHSAEFFLGIDAGGSRTTAVLVAADGTEVGRAEGPAGVVRPGKAAQAAAAIVGTARRAADQAAVTLPVAVALVGAAGAGRATEREQLAAELCAGAGVARQVRVMGDVELALHAAWGNGSGIVVAAGTGAAAFARDPTGAVHRIGGHGWQLGDDGSGYWLGRRALGLVARDRDGIGDAGSLPRRILAALSLPGFDDLVRWAATASPTAVAGLAPVLLAAARDDDAVAQGLITEAARELVTLATSLSVRFPPGDSVPVALTGGLLGDDSPLRVAVEAALRVRLPASRLHEGVIDPAATAARLARC